MDGALSPMQGLEQLSGELVSAGRGLAIAVNSEPFPFPRLRAVKRSGTGPAFKNWTGFLVAVLLTGL